MGELPFFERFLFSLSFYYLIYIYIIQFCQITFSVPIEISFSAFEREIENTANISYFTNWQLMHTNEVWNDNKKILSIYWEN